MTEGINKTNLNPPQSPVEANKTINGQSERNMVGEADILAAFGVIPKKERTPEEEMPFVLEELLGRVPIRIRTKQHISRIRETAERNAELRANKHRSYEYRKDNENALKRRKEDLRPVETVTASLNEVDRLLIELRIWQDVAENKDENTIWNNIISYSVNERDEIINILNNLAMAKKETLISEVLEVSQEEIKAFGMALLDEDPPSPVAVPILLTSGRFQDKDVMAKLLEIAEKMKHDPSLIGRWGSILANTFNLVRNGGRVVFKPNNNADHASKIVVKEEGEVKVEWVDDRPLDREDFFFNEEEDPFHLVQQMYKWGNVLE